MCNCYAFRYVSREKEDDTIVEATSGNTGISLAMMCAERGLKCVIVMPSDMSEERKKMMKFFGAEIIEVDEGDFDGAISHKEHLAKTHNYKELNQFNNKLNIECHYNTTFVEIMNDYQLLEEDVSAFILGTGTGGTLMGIEQGCKDWNLNSKIIAVEPLESPVMSGGEKGLHGIQGIGDGSKFLVDLEFVDEIVLVSTKDATDFAKKLAKNGLFIGVSAGANVLASERWLSKNNKKHAITVLCDRGERYFSCL